MDYTTRSPSLQRLSKSEGKWIGYQLKVHGLTQKAVAERAGKSRNTVANVLCGSISSASIYIALSELLGYESFSEMLIAMKRSAA